MTTSGYTLLDVPTPAQTLIHVHPGADELGRVYQPALAINATPGAFLAALAAEPLPARPAWRERLTQRARRLRRVAGAATGARRRRPVADRALARRAPAGRRDRHQRRGQLFDVDAPPVPLPRFPARSWRPTPARWATAFPPPSRPRPSTRDRVVVSWNGDGCFLMNGQELATAVQYGLAVIFVVIDNGMYGTIRMHQEKTYPARVSGTDLAIPTSRRWRAPTAQPARRCVRTDEFAPAFERALRGVGSFADPRQGRPAGADDEHDARRSARAGRSRAHGRHS